MIKKQIIKRIYGLLMAFVITALVPLSAFADTTGTVNETARVRADASTNSDVMGSADKDAVVTISDQKTDASGNVWYHVTLSNGTTGYIRSDLLTVAETPAADTATASTDTSADTAVADTASAGSSGVDISQIVLPDGVTPMDTQKATIKVAAGKIRGDASTNDTIVTSLAEGTELVLAGTKTGSSDGNTWYYVAFVEGGTQKYGYIRNDLVTPGEVIAVSAPVEETPVETTEAVEEQPVSSVNNDYELVYTPDENGVNTWYLYNHIDATSMKLQEILDFVSQQGERQAKSEAKIKQYRIIIIALGVLLAIAIVGVIILVIKMRNGSYEDYEDYDDDDDDDDDEDEEEEKPRRFGRFTRRKSYDDDEDYDDDDEEDEEEEEVVPRRMPNEAKRRAAAGNAPRKPVDYDLSEDEVELKPRKTEKKTKNFLLDDDDFEYDFLTIDKNNK